MKRLTLFVLLLAFTVPSASAAAKMADKAVRAKVAGIDLIAYPTEVEDVVTFRGSLPAGDSFAPPSNFAIPTLVGEMLDKGTEKQDKYAIAQKLDEIGAVIDFSVGGVMVEFHGKCLRKDLPTVIALLAEQLRSPKFPEEEFAKLKKQMIGQLQRALESTAYRASQAFAEKIFPVGHPNYSPPTGELVKAIEKADLAEAKAFHKKYYGPAQATLVVVGDVDPEVLKREVAQAFGGWEGGETVPDFQKTAGPPAGREEVIAMADKPNVTVIIGQGSGLEYKDEDALPLRVGTAVLGSGFTGRLMANVRDKEGLTYGIGANVSNDAFIDGAWQITGNFAPDLLEKGMASTRRQLDAWYKEGVTNDELDRMKTNLVGTFKVGLATTDGLASALLNAVHRGYDVTWLDEYPERIQALSLEQVNSAIKQYLQPDKMTVIKAGTVTPPKKQE